MASVIVLVLEQSLALILQLGGCHYAAHDAGFLSIVAVGRMIMQHRAEMRTLIKPHYDISQ